MEPPMKKILRFVFGIAMLAVLVALGAAGYFLLWQGHAPAKRPDLVRLPAMSIEAPRGYPTQNAVMLSLLAGWVDLIKIGGDIPVPEGVTEEKDIEYGRVGSKPLQLDLYRPAQLGAPVPGLIFIHGGGWKMGSRTDYKYYTVRFAKQGYVAATVGYRFAPETKFPGCVEDVKCAIRWMRENAAKLNVDPERIVTIGGSAGGHLALMAGYAPDRPELEGSGGHPGVSSRVAAVVDFYGPTDLTTPFALAANEVRQFMPKTYEEDPALYKLASPLFQLDASDPPTLILHGTVDTIVPVEQSDRLAEKLQELKIPYYYARIDGWPHAMDMARPINEYALQLIGKFLEETFKKPATP